MLFRTFITTLILCSSAGAEISFNQDIRPILSAKCIMCHGPDDGVDAKGKANRKAGLRLDTPEGAYAVKDGIQAIKPGSLEDSEAWIRITDKADPMPPEDGHAKPLSSAEKDLIRRWIKEGGEYEDFWAFVPAKKQNPPGAKNSIWPKSSIDKFTLAKMESKGKSPKPRADKRTLIRRLSLDLTGLPPTLDEIKTFLDDTSPEAYTKLVDHSADELPHHAGLHEPVALGVLNLGASLHHFPALTAGPDDALDILVRALTFPYQERNLAVHVLLAIAKRGSGDMEVKIIR